MNPHRQLLGAGPGNGAVSSGHSAAVALTLASAVTVGETRVSLAHLLGVEALGESVLHAAQNSQALAFDSRVNLQKAIFLDTPWQGDYRTLGGRLSASLDGMTTDVENFADSDSLQRFVRE